MESGRGRPLNRLKDFTFRKFLDALQQDEGNMGRENHQAMFQKYS
jgi:hypothetical protein